MTTLMYLKRAKKDAQEILCDTEDTSIKLQLIDDKYTDLIGEIKGPIDTPYESGTFTLKIDITDRYPFLPPEVRFLTKIWHPNISSETGVICLDILKDKWAAVMTIRTLLISIQALLADAVPDDPQDAVVAKQCRDSPEVFALTAKYWTNKFAGGTHNLPDLDEKISKLADLGFDRIKCCTALSCNDWDLDRAGEYLCSDSD